MDTDAPVGVLRIREWRNSVPLFEDGFTLDRALFLENSIPKRAFLEPENEGPKIEYNRKAV
jgi:hypothetical protein